MQEGAIRELVREYAWACNALLLCRESKAFDLYAKFFSLSNDQQKIVFDECKHLISSKDLPEPVLSHWAKYLENYLPKDKYEEGETGIGPAK